MTRAIFTGIVTLLAAFSAVFYLSAHSLNPDQEPSPLPTVQNTPQTTAERSPLQAAAYEHFLTLFGPSQAFELVEPVDGFRVRATKKTFGLFITPDTSPIQGDRFTGYHTGVDAEFTDISRDVPVRAIANGTIVFRDWTKGYGGVIVIRHIIGGTPIYALYGHLDQSSFLPTNITTVVAGQQIAVLGDDHSQETDGVRKHLHFSVSTTEKLDLRGYVQTEQELDHWLDPLDFYPR